MAFKQIPNNICATPIMTESFIFKEFVNVKPFEDIHFELGQADATGILKITINRPQVRNAFRPKTVLELQEAFKVANYIR